MKIIYLYSILFFSFCCHCFAQTKPKKLSSQEKSLDSILNLNLVFDTPQKSIRVADSILVAIGSNENLNTYKVRAHHIKSFCYLILQKDDLSLKEIKIALNYFEKDSTLIKKLPDIYTATSYGAYSHAQGEGNFYLGYSIISKTLKNIDSLDYENQATMIMALADLNLKMNNKEKAKQLALKTLRIKKTTDLRENLTYLTLGSIYKLSNLDSAYYYFKKAAPFFKKVNESSYHNNNADIAEILIKKGKLKEAKKLLLETEKNQLNNNDFLYIYKTYTWLSEIAGYEKNKELELEYLMKADKYAKGNIYLTDREELYQSYMNYYKSIGDFSKKRLYELKAQNIRDSIQYRENIFLTKELEAKYKNEAKIQEIKQQKELIEIQKHQKRNLYIVLIVILSLLLFTVFLYRNKLKTQNQLSLEKVKTLKESQKVKTFQSHLEGQNKERKRIAKDLHDSISGNLAAIKMKLTNIDSKNFEQINPIIANIDDTYNKVRLISHNLLPKDNVSQNYLEQLNKLINLYKGENLTIEFEIFPIEEIDELDEQLKSETLKILQELMTNITKHSQASKSIVNLTLHDNYLNLLVEDNGVGFQKNKISTGIGFKNIFSRVNDLNGTIDIDSTEGRGATITINIPIA
jgi:signal transduction histidine kinase